LDQVTFITVWFNSFLLVLVEMPTKAGKAGVEETEAVARVLFMQFCRDRFQAEGIEQLPVCEESTELDEYFQKE
jgi:hypothetical protein